ncbi:MAG TPA: MMPL family transporter [Vicinamibacterales bacterium]|nr:MMPL family transporter [Vicinamibacterales bacterium]
MLERLQLLLDFARRRATTVFVAAACLGVIGAVLVTRVSFDPDVLKLLPQDSPAVRDFQIFLRDFGTFDHLYLVFGSADDIGEHSELVDAYVAELRRSPEIETVDAQLFDEDKDWSYLSDRQLFLLGAQGAADALQRFRRPQLDREIAHARDLLSVPSPQVKALVRQDPLGLLTLLRDQLGRQKGFVGLNPAAEGYVSADGHSRLVIVKPRGSPFDTDFCKALFARLSAVEARARQQQPEDPAHGPETLPVTIESAGAYRISLEAERLIRRDSLVNALGSLVLLLLIVVVVFRTPWVMIYGVVPLTLAALLALGIMGFLKGSLSPATSGSAGMLFGLGIDGVVLLYLRYLEEREAGYAPPDANRRLAGTAASVILAQGTTAATFLALLFIDFPTLQDLGGLVGLGIGLCCVLTMVVLPALAGRRATAPLRRAPTTPWLGHFVLGAPGPIVWSGLLATVLLGVASAWLKVDLGVEKLQAQTEGARFEREMGERFSLPRDVLLGLNGNQQIDPLLDADERLTGALASREPSVAVGGISVLLPSARAQSAVSQVIRTSNLNPEEVKREIRAAQKKAGFQPDAFDPFLRRLPTLLNPDERITYQGLEEHGLDSVVSRFLTTRSGRYEAVTYLYPQKDVDIERLRSILREADPALRLTGLTVVNRDVARRFFPEFLKGIAIGTVAVAILVYVVFGTVGETLLALLPTAVGFVWSAGLLALFRVELDLFSLFAAVTFIGISVDYSIYILYRYRVEARRDATREIGPARTPVLDTPSAAARRRQSRGPRRAVFARRGGRVGVGPHEIMSEVLTRTGAAVIIACSTALIGFGTLMSSSYGPLRTFGIVSVVTLSSCLVASVVLLPALVFVKPTMFKRGAAQP